MVFAATVDARKSAEELGAEGYVGKPFEVQELLGTVERHVSTRA